MSADTVSAPDIDAPEDAMLSVSGMPEGWLLSLSGR